MKTEFFSFFLSIIIFYISSFSGCSINGGNTNNTPNVDIELGIYDYNIPSRYYSEGIKNIVKRSRQIKEIEWTPVETLEAFNSDYYFEKGVEVVGIPYSQPVSNGKFIIYGASLEEFIKASKVKGGVFYTEKGLYEEPSCYYGFDCSSFVSYAWNCKNRLTAKLLSDFAVCKGNSLNDIQVGDALIKLGTGKHAVLVTGVVEDSKKNIVWIEITEQTPPITKQTAYGKKDGNKELFSIDEFLMLYLNNGYKIYRNTKNRDSTPFVHTCVSPIGEYCDNCYSKNNHKSLDLADIFAENYFFEAQFANCENSNDVKFSYSISHIHLGWEKYTTDPEHYIKVREKPEGENSIILIPPGSFITIFEKCFDSNGELWGRTKYNSKTGWVYLQSSKYLGGEVNAGEEINALEEEYETLDSDKYGTIHKCMIYFPISDFSTGHKLQVFATDSKGNRFLVGEYLNP